MAKNIGKIVQVIGPVVDIRYAAGQLPALNNAIVVEKGEGQRITVEGLSILATTSCAASRWLPPMVWFGAWTASIPKRRSACR